MPRKKEISDFDQNRLDHMIRAISEIRKFLRAKSAMHLTKDRQLLLAIVKDIEIIGEAAAKITDDYKRSTPHIPWSEMIATRNRLIHGYFDIDTEIVWQTVQQDLIPLEKQLRDLLKS